MCACRAVRQPEQVLQRTDARMALLNLTAVTLHARLFKNRPDRLGELVEVWLRTGGSAWNLATAKSRWLTTQRSCFRAGNASGRASP